MSNVEDTELEPEESEDERETDGRVHFSRLKLMQRSPLHYKTNPRRSSSSQYLGRATHSFLLGKRDSVVVYEGKRDKRVKAYQEFKAQHPRAQIVKPDEMRNVEGMAESIARHTEATRLLTGYRENYLQWEIEGHLAAGTPDVWRLNGDVTELKTDDDAEPQSFLRSAERYCYHAQLTWYEAGLRAKGLIEGRGELSIVVVESSEPWAVSVVYLDDDIRAEGEALWRGWLQRLEECEALGSWPSYSDAATVWSPRQQRLF